MDKETLSNYGWIVICVLVFAVMIALATPFGTFVADGFKATYTGLFQTGDSAMDVVMNATGGCTHKETEVANVTADYSGDTVCKKCGTVLETGKYVIPSGGTYYVGVTSATEKNYTGATATYTTGQEFPETVNVGDVYVYESYEYRFCQYWEYGWKTSTEQNGWGVRCINNVAEPGPMLKEVNGKPITNLRRTFAGLGGPTIAPEIPDTVVNMEATFDGCSKLTIAPNIPQGVTTLLSAFRNCPISTYHGSTDPDGDFSSYVIPNSVTTMYLTFSGCTNMVKAPEIPNSVTNMSSTFGGCTNLTTAPVIPESVTNMNGTFGGCTKLSTAPVIPSGVTDVGMLFSGCTALTGIVEINATRTPGNSGCFRNVDFDAQNLTITGTCTNLDLLGRTGVNYCETCNGKCQGNH